MHMLEQLESRVMMSVTVTAAKLTADQDAIVAAKTAYLSTITTLGRNLVSDSQALETLLPPGKSNLALAKKALAAEKKVVTALKKETTAFANDSVNLSAKAVVAGKADIAKPSTSTDAKERKAGLAIFHKTNADSNKITNDQSLTNLYTALNSIVIANPSAISFSTGVQTLENDVPLNAVTNAGAALTQALLTLGFDLRVVA